MKKAYRYWSKTIPIFWVAGLKGKVGDWEYTTDSKKAIALTPYWQKRFNADCNAVRVNAYFVQA